MMNSVHAGSPARSSRSASRTRELVEYGAPLFRVEPDDARRRHRRHDDARRQPEPLGRDRPHGHDILAIAPTLERVGFHALDFTSSTHMAVSVPLPPRGPVGADPAHARGDADTLLNFITTGMRFIAWQPCDEDVMRLAFRCVVRNGIRRFQFAEPANDPQALRRVARMAREEGVEEIVVGMTYSISPVHTHAYYAERVAALADCADIDRFYLKDPGGLLTTDAVRELAPHFVATGRTGGAPQPLHDRARAARLPRGREGRLRRAPHGDRAGRQRDVAADRRVDGAQPRGRGIRAPARSRRRSPEPARTSASSSARSACRRACRASTTPPTTTTSCRAGW